MPMQERQISEVRYQVGMTYLDICTVPLVSKDGGEVPEFLRSDGENEFGVEAAQQLWRISSAFNLLDWYLILYSSNPA